MVWDEDEWPPGPPDPPRFVVILLAITLSALVVWSVYALLTQEVSP